jgi:hypothetical protein
LIILFFLTFTFNVRKVFLTPYSFLNGQFNEYMTLSLGWADILIIAIIIIYTIKYILSQFLSIRSPNNLSKYKNNNLSIFNSDFFSRETILLSIFFLWAGLSIFWSMYKTIAVYRFLSLLEIFIFAAILVQSLKNSKLFQTAILALIANGAFQSILGTAQFIHNKSVGIYLLGESLIGPNVAGVAKITIDSEKHIRSYGTFPHPNLLAAFLLIPIIIIIHDALIRYFDVARETIIKDLSFNKLIYFLLILVTGFIFAVSRSAFAGLILGILFLLVWQFGLAAKAWNTKFVSLTKRNIFLMFVLASLAGASLVFLFQSTSLFSSQSLKERNLYQIVSYETISTHFFKGVGLGQLVLNEHLLHPRLEGWQYQPAHNVLLLIFSELGILGFSIASLVLIFFLFCFLKRPVGPQLTYNLFYVIIISFLPFLFFDHFFWDLKIGLLIFSIPISFFLATRNNHQKKMLSNSNFEKN